jgi:hypothetical protein
MNQELFWKLEDSLPCQWPAELERPAPRDCNPDNEMSPQSAKLQHLHKISWPKNEVFSIAPLTFLGVDASD